MSDLRKPFTLAELQKDGACKEGLKFVGPLVESGADVAASLASHNLDWFGWAVRNGYDCESARRPGFTWDHQGRITATAGDEGTATAGEAGTATAGYAGTATAGRRGTATAGDAGTATAGDAGTATAGDEGTATAGRRGTATAGDEGTATAGDEGTATAGYAGTLVLAYVDKRSRWRLKVGYIGEDGLEPNVPYRLDEDGKFVRADQEQNQ